MLPLRIPLADRSFSAIVFPRQSLRLIKDPVKGIFVPLAVLSFATILIGTINYGMHEPSHLPRRTTLTSLVDSCTIGSYQSESNIRPVLGLRFSLAPRLFPDAHDLVQQTSRSDHLHTGLGLPDLPHDARRRHRV